MGRALDTISDMHADGKSLTEIRIAIEAISNQMHDADADADADAEALIAEIAEIDLVTAILSCDAVQSRDGEAVHTICFLLRGNTDYYEEVSGAFPDTMYCAHCGNEISELAVTEETAADIETFNVSKLEEESGTVYADVEGTKWYYHHLESEYPCDICGRSLTSAYYDSGSDAVCAHHVVILDDATRIPQ